MPKATTGDRGEAIALAVLAAAMVAAVLALLYWGRDQVMAGDDLFYAQRLAENSLGHVILHSNLYLIVLPMALYKAMFELFGIGSTLPYRLVAIALSLLCAGLFYAIARRRIGALFALTPTILILFFGSGWEEIITGVRLPSLFAIASGLGAILALERGDRRGDGIAALLLCLSVTSHPTGVGFLIAAAVMIALRGSPRRWRSAWVVLVPAALYGAFLVSFQHTSNTPNSVGAVIGYQRSAWTALTAAVSGLSSVLDAPVYDTPVAQFASGCLLGLIVIGAVARWGHLQPTFWAALAGLIWMLASPRLSPGGISRTPDAPRYLYPEAIFLLWVLVELASAWRGAGTVRTRTAIAGVATGVLALGVWSNVAKLHRAGSSIRTASAEARGQYSAFELESSRRISSYTRNVFLPTAGDYLAAAAAYGSIGLSAGELAQARLETRAAADRTLVAALGIKLRPASPAKPTAGPRPRVVRLLRGSAANRANCVHLRPSRSSEVPDPAQLGASDTASLLADLELPAGGVRIQGRDLAAGALTLGRFADPPVAELKAPAGTRATRLGVPRDRVDVPWKLEIASPKAITVCGLAPYRVTGSS